MTVDPRIERLNARRDAGEITDAQYETELAQLEAEIELAASATAADAPERRWLGEQTAWPSQAPAAPWQSGASPQPPSPYGAPSQWPSPQAPPPAAWPQSPQAAQHPPAWQQPQQPGWPPTGAPPQPSWPQQPTAGAPPAHPAPHGWQQQPAQQPTPWAQPQQPGPQPAPWAQPPQQQWQQTPWAQAPQAPMVPAGMYAPPGYAPPMPQTYMTQAILATMFCCVPLGVVAIVKASQVSSAWQAGDIATAQQRSAEARTWVNWSVVSSLLLGGLWFVFVLLAGIGGAI